MHEQANYVDDENFLAFQEQCAMEVEDMESQLLGFYDLVSANIKEVKFRSSCMWPISKMVANEEKWAEDERLEMDLEEKRSKLNNTLHALNEELAMAHRAKRIRAGPKPPPGPPSHLIGAAGPVL